VSDLRAQVEALPFVGATGEMGEHDRFVLMSDVLAKIPPGAVLVTETTLAAAIKETMPGLWDDLDDPEGYMADIVAHVKGEWPPLPPGPQYTEDDPDWSAMVSPISDTDGGHDER
jgi:hypothetical protein